MSLMQVLVNAEDLKQALNHINGPYSSTGSWGSEITRCDGCDGINHRGWGEPINHQESCKWLMKEAALERLRKVIQTAQLIDPSLVGK